MWFLKSKILLFILVLLVVGALIYQLKMTRINGAENPVRAPDFSLKNLNGQTVRLSDFTGKIVILNFWATWCPPCRIEIPHLKELYAQYRDRGVEVIGISLDSAGEQVVRDFVEKNQIDYAILLGDEKITLDYGGILGIPTSFIIDRQGRIRQRLFGLQTKEVFEQALKGLF
jgi:peroxiredoxin